MKLSAKTVNKRMLALPELLKEMGMITYRQEFLDVIGMQKQNFRQIQLGIAGFTLDQIVKACDAYNLNANWLTGAEPKMFRAKAKETTRRTTNSKTQKQI